MLTDEIHILPTNKTPEVLLNSNGTIKITGRAIDESITGVPEQISVWSDAYVSNPADITKIVIALEFLNSYNTVILTSILKKFSKVIFLGKKLVISWYYEEDDVDLFERGEYISSIINVPFEFIITKNIADI
jgi:hypothetical protein